MALSMLPVAQAAQSTEDEWEGAIGLTATHGPAYAGADERDTNVRPGFYLRYGRLSITNASGFVTRGNDTVIRGLGVELGGSRTWKASLGLRYDGGRSESTSPALAGLGSVRSTLRLRLGGRYHLDEHWQLHGAWTLDALGRGGGNLGEARIERHQRWSERTTWIAGAGVTYAGDRYLQSWFGVTPEQSARSGYRVHEPGAGVRDVVVYANARSEIARDWVLLAGIGASRLLGSAADSPFVFRRTGISVNGGLAWSF